MRPAAVADVEELPGGVGQAGEPAAGPGGGDAVAVGVLEIVHPAVGAEPGLHSVGFAEEERAADQRYQAAWSPAGEIVCRSRLSGWKRRWPPSVPEGPPCRRTSARGSLPAAGPGPASAERALFVSPDDVREKTRPKVIGRPGHRRSCRWRSPVANRAQADRLLHFERPQPTDIDDARPRRPRYWALSASIRT